MMVESLPAHCMPYTAPTCDQEPAFGAVLPHGAVQLALGIFEALPLVHDDVAPAQP